jgi:pimeloyl-ACP methyl ester carboxylesterase
MNNDTEIFGDHIRLIDGGAVRYRIAGRGPVLVFHPPGWGIGAAPYAATLAPLEQHFTVVYVWPRGAAGNGTTSADSTLDVGVFVEDLERLRHHLGVSDFLLAGHSHGGLVVLHYALRHPDRVNQLLLLSPQLTGIPYDEDNAAGEGDDQPAEVAEAMRFLSSVGGFDALSRFNGDRQATEFLARILPLYFLDPKARQPLVTALDGITLPHRVMQSVAASDAGFPLSLDELGTLGVHTVLVSGRHDRFASMSQVLALTRSIPCATSLVFERSGHFPWLEEPAPFFDQVVGVLLAPEVEEAVIAMPRRNLNCGRREPRDAGDGRAR